MSIFDETHPHAGTTFDREARVVRTTWVLAGEERTRGQQTGLVAMRVTSRHDKSLKVYGHSLERFVIHLDGSESHLIRVGAEHLPPVTPRVTPVARFNAHDLQVAHKNYLMERGFMKKSGLEAIALHWAQELQW